MHAALVAKSNESHCVFLCMCIVGANVPISLSLYDFLCRYHTRADYHHCSFSSHGGSNSCSADLGALLYILLLSWKWGHFTAWRLAKYDTIIHLVPQLDTVFIHRMEVSSVDM